MTRRAAIITSAAAMAMLVAAAPASAALSYVEATQAATPAKLTSFAICRR